MTTLVDSNASYQTLLQALTAIFNFVVRHRAGLVHKEQKIFAVEFIAHFTRNEHPCIVKRYYF